MKEEKNATKEAFDTAAFAQFFPGPSWRQAGTVLLVFGIPRNDGDSTKNGVNPGNETQTPICSVQANDTGTNLVEAHGPF
jgi:hypothetical protein